MRCSLLINRDFGHEQVLDLMRGRLFRFSTLGEYVASCWQEAKKLQFTRCVLPYSDPAKLP